MLKIMDQYKMKMLKTWMSTDGNHLNNNGNNLNNNLVETKVTGKEEFGENDKIKWRRRSNVS